MDNSATLEISKIIMAIRNNAVDKKIVEQQLAAIQENFGEDAFVPYNFEKKEKPWNDAYFAELDKKITAGAWSREFILHFAEVHDEIQKNKSSSLTRIWKALPLSLKVIAIALVVIGAVSGAIIGEGIGTIIGLCLGALIGGFADIILIRIVALIFK